MKKVMLVDDDTIVRISLRSMVDWGSYGYEIVADASNGEQALQWLSENTVDLLITDMKMPIMDGLTLLEKLKERQKLPHTVVLSSYHDFKLVRESFRIGACDYLLKSDINEEVLVSFLEKLNQMYPMERGQDADTKQQWGSKEKSREEQLADMATGRRGPEEDFFHMNYYLIRFEIDDFNRQVIRFGSDLKNDLTEPLLEFARQIPRVAARCILGSISPSQYVLLYQVSDVVQSQDNVASTCNQLKNVWNNYMNLSVSAGISSMGYGSEQFEACFEEAGKQLELHYLTGKGTICYPWKSGQVSIETMERAEQRYEKLLHALRSMDELALEAERQNLFIGLEACELNEAREECLAVVNLVARNLRELHHNIWDVFQEDVDYYLKLSRLLDIRNLEIWMNNYLSWILEYQANATNNRQADLMIRAKRFIMDNYSNPELTLGSVAGYIGLNEKYFSSRFTKETGSTFSNYLTEIRILKAKELMDKTDLKIYEISQKAGYNNVEHFTRMFKKVCKVSPGAYKKMGIM